jgi:hypothetical protein
MPVARTTVQIPEDITLEDLGFRVANGLNNKPAVRVSTNDTRRIGSVILETVAKIPKVGEVVTSRLTVPIIRNEDNITGEIRDFAGAISWFVGRDEKSVRTAQLSSWVGDLVVKEFYRLTGVKAIDNAAATIGKAASQMGQIGVSLSGPKITADGEVNSDDDIPI